MIKEARVSFDMLLKRFRKLNGRHKVGFGVRFLAKGSRTVDKKYSTNFRSRQDSVVCSVFTQHNKFVKLRRGDKWAI